MIPSCFSGLNHRSNIGSTAQLWILFSIALIGSPLAQPDTSVAIEVIAREQWGARSARGDISTWDAYNLERPSYTRVVLHVTAMGTGEGPGEARRIQNFQMDTRGFSDMAYNFLIDSDGNVFRGRSLDNVPAHAGRSVEADRDRDIRRDPDFGSIGIAFSADTEDALTQAQEAAAIALIEELRRDHPIEQIMTHAEIGEMLEAAGLTPVTEFDAMTCPGLGNIDSIVRIRRALDSDFNEARYRALFERNE